ncbi:MAG: hypothetical protein V1750_10730 [Acidobacteriota bacterium]
MILALDTDVLINWQMGGAPFHAAAQNLVREHVQQRCEPLGLVPQVIHEFLHVSTDGRRFERPLSMGDALLRCNVLWHAPEVLRITPSPSVLARTLELLGSLQLGRKRILDTSLAASLEAAGVRRLATFNPDDFAAFPFIETVTPR